MSIVQGPNSLRWRRRTDSEHFHSRVFEIPSTRISQYPKPTQVQGDKASVIIPGLIFLPVLPADLWLQVADLLNYPDLVALRRTCYSLRCLTNGPSLRSALIQLECDFATSFDQGTRSSEQYLVSVGYLQPEVQKIRKLAPCYHCLLLCAPNAIPRQEPHIRNPFNDVRSLKQIRWRHSQITADLRNAATRCCIICMTKSGVPGSKQRWVVLLDQFLVKCRMCGKTMCHDFQHRIGGAMLNPRQERAGLCDFHWTYDPEDMVWRQFRAELGNLVPIVRDCQYWINYRDRRGVPGKPFVSDGAFVDKALLHLQDRIADLRQVWADADWKWIPKAIE